MIEEIVKKIKEEKNENIKDKYKETLYEEITYLEGEDLRISCLDKYSYYLTSFGIETIILTFRYPNIIKYLDKYINRLDSDNITNIILELTNNDIFTSLDKYISKLLPKDIIVVIESLEESSRRLMIEKYAKNIFPKNGHNLIKLLKVRPYLSLENPSLSDEILSDEIVNKYGYEFISELLEYDTDASEIVLKYDSIQNWIEYLKSLPIYNTKLLHYGINAYPRMRILIGQVIYNKDKITDKELNNLVTIMKQNNIYRVSSLEELINYKLHRIHMLESKLNESNIEVDTIYKAIFNVYDKDNIVKIYYNYGFNSNLYLNTLLNENVLDKNDILAINYITRLMNAITKKDAYQLFLELKDNDNIPEIDEITSKIEKYINKKFQSSLLDLDNKELPSKEVDGIKVIELNVIEFKILAHSIFGYDPALRDLAPKIVENPSLWNSLEGSSTISTSLIGDTQLKVAEAENSFDKDNEKVVIYGFTKLPDNAILLMGKNDIYTYSGGRILRTGSIENEFMIPEVLEAVSSPKYINEVVLDRKSGNNKEYDNRLQPDCIVCFDNNINDASKKAAKYFNIPIVLIDRKKYKSKEEYYYNKYHNKDIDTFTIEDIKRILYNKIDNIETKYNLILKLLDYSKKNNLITTSEYIKLLNELKVLLSYYLLHIKNGRYTKETAEDNISMNIIDKKLSKVKVYS